MIQIFCALLAAVIWALLFIIFVLVAEITKVWWL